MHGLPEDLDLSFFVGTTLIQLGVGEHKIVIIMALGAGYDPSGPTP